MLRLTEGASPMARLCLALVLLALGKTERAGAALEALDDQDRPELVAMARQAAATLAADPAADLTALRAGLEHTARLTALLPEHGTA